MAYAKNPREVFPVDSWEKIIKRVESEDLTSCNLVCSDFKEYVGDVGEKIWKSYFPRYYTSGTLMLFTRRYKGTRFTSAGDVDAFMEKYRDFDLSQGSPFENDTVILYNACNTEFDEMHRKLPILLEKFGGRILNCLYFVHFLAHNSITNIPLIYGMTNLRSLTIFCSKDWLTDTSVKKEMAMMMELPLDLKRLEHLTHLDVLGHRGYTVVKPMFNACGHNIKRLWLYGRSFDFFSFRDKHCKEIGETLPNVEELKLGEVTPAVLQVLASIASTARWPLKRLSVRLCDGDVSEGIADLLKNVSAFSPTLEKFHFYVNAERIYKEDFKREGIAFPKVSHLRVPYFFVNRNNIVALTQLVRTYFPNLKYLQFVDDILPQMLYEEKRLLHDDTIEKFLNTLWANLPLSLEIISVRYRASPRLNAGSMAFVLNKLRPNPMSTRV